MKTIIKALIGIVGLVILLLIGVFAYVSIKGIPTYEVEKVQIDVQATPAKVEEGERIASMLCFHCHMDPDSRKLTGIRLLDIDPAFGVVYAPNITQHEEHGMGKYTDSEIAYLLRTGIKRDGKYAPPYMPKLPNLSDRDMEAIIAFLRSDHPAVQPDNTKSIQSNPSFLTKFLVNFLIKPYPYPENPIPHPSPENKVEFGEYIATAQLGCSACHSADFKTYNELVPEKSPGFFGGGNLLFDLEGNKMLSPNITMDETGIGSWSKADFVKAVRYGIRPDGSTLKYPMFTYSALSESEVEAIYTYLKTVPELENEVPRNEY